jgi:hypothetical protein
MGIFTAAMLTLSLLVAASTAQTIDMVDKGWGSWLIDTYGLAQCEGDCDSDDDCRGQLSCFQNNGGVTPPGCSGSVTWEMDYCYNPASGTQTTTTPAPTTSEPKTLEFIDWRPEVADTPRKECQGHCKSDAQCEGDLVCLDLGAGRVDAGQTVPGCLGTGTYDVAYCYDPANAEDATAPIAFSAWLNEGRQFIPISGTVFVVIVVALAVLVILAVAIFRGRSWRKQKNEEKSYAVVDALEGKDSDSETDAEEAAEPMV